MKENLVKYIVENGGKIKPLIIPFDIAKGTGQMNPSLFIDEGKILVNLRNVGYVLIHSENQQKFNCRWGPLAYQHPEEDQTLRTLNIFMELDNNYDPVSINVVDTKTLDKPPKWTFIGLEDARIVRWDGKLFLIGVRRDTTTNGEGRMELSEIEISGTGVNEISRERIEPPQPSYCEKNWMPILDMPYHLVKWSNPTEVVKVDIENGTSETIFLSKTHLPNYRDFRGGSQVLPYKGGHIAIIHEVDLFNNELGQKDAFYYHRFIVWDSQWNIIKISDDFNFMEARIEFCCGLAIVDDKMLITFGFQDNAAFIVESPLKLMEDFING
jgi:hypothetical protein